MDIILQGLNLQDCSLESLEGISGCRNLSRVLLPLNNLTSIHKDLLSLKDTLENLDISGNPITEFPSFFTRLTKLKVKTFAALADPLVFHESRSYLTSRNSIDWVCNSRMSCVFKLFLYIVFFHFLN